MAKLIPLHVKSVAILLLLASLLAACGSGAAPAANQGAATTSAQPTAAGSAAGAETTVAAGGETASGQAVKIVVDGGVGDDAAQQDKDNFAQLLAGFQQTHPNVTIEAVPGGYNPEAFAAKVAGGTVEDAFGVWFTEPQKFIQQGIVADITEIFNASPYADCINEDAMGVVSDTNGRIYGIPVSMYGLGLVYNRALFEQAGLDPNSPPTTWDEVRQYAKQIADTTGKPGFAFLSTENQGGWHFTTVLFSKGGDAEAQQDGKWTAVFNSPTGVEVLQLLKEMRWSDNSLTEEQLLNIGKVEELMGTGQLGMAIGGIPGGLKERFGADINDFGLAALPQGEGNATLGGGYAYMFNKDATPEELQAAVDWALYRNFDLAIYETDLKRRQERGDPIGIPEVAVLTGECQAQRDALTQQYANVPTENFAPFAEASQNIRIRTEPPIEVQKMYASIDPAVQAVLTDETADPQQALDEAAQQFQTTVLDQAQQ